MTPAVPSHRSARLAGALTLGLLLVGGAVGVASGAAQPSAVPAPVAVVAPLTVAVVGDYGVDTTAEGQVATMVAGWAPDLVVTTGDNFYSNGTDTGTARYDRVTGKYYCAFIKGAAAGTNCPSGGTATVNRFFPSTGNHDWTDGDITNYRAYFDLPGAGVTSQSPTGSELYYDVRNGPLHLFFIDSQAALASAAEMTTQKAWLQAALAASDAPWKVVVGHHPPYSSSSTHGSSTAMRWPYASWGADLVLNGHDHTYERIDNGGLTYIVDGLGGAGRYGFASSPVTGSLVRYNSNWGALRLTIHDTSLTGDFISLGGIAQDHFVLASDTTSATLQDGMSPAAYAGTRDATISQVAPTTAFGATTTLLVDGDDPPGSGSDLATLIRFDTASIPAGATIVSASLRFKAVDPSANSYSAYPVLRAWDEATVTWTNASTAVAWATAGAAGGADRGSTAVGTLSAASLGPVAIDLNASGVALVQGWVAGTTANNGIVVAGSSQTDGIDLSSREAAMAADRPALVVAYRVTAPTILTVSTSSLAGGTVGTGYSATLAATGGTPPYSWAVTSGATPPGITLSSGGALTGTPTTAGTYSLTAEVTDGASVKASAPLSIIVAAAAAPGTFGKSSPSNNKTGVRSPVSLSWGASTGSARYEVCFDRDINSVCNSGWVSVGTGRSTARTLTSKAVYSWQVRAVNAANVSTLANGGAWWRLTAK